MNEQECNLTYKKLENLLDYYGLNWVIQQVNEQIRLGKISQQEVVTIKETKETSLFGMEYDYSENFKKGPKATFPVTAKYESNERLELLVDAIMHAVVDPIDMELSFINFTKKNSKPIKKIQFFKDEPGSEPRTINMDISFRQSENSTRLAELLSSLRKEISK